VKGSKNNMKTTGQKGFGLILVIMAISAVALIMFVLSSDANTMLFQSDTAYLQATQRNLTASALAWARHNAKTQTPQNLDKPIDLDTSNLNTRGPSTLTVTIEAPSQVKIDTSCTRKRRTLTSHNKYKL